MSASLLAALRTAAGSAAAVLERMETPGGVAGVVPAAVVRPASVDALAAVLAFCSDEGIAVEPAGGCSWLGAGRPPSRPPVVVSTASLQGITEHEPADLVVGVRAGTACVELERALRRHGQTLALDPAAAAAATVGAAVALGSAGPLRAGHGTPRDRVLGMELVTGDGRVLCFGGRVVKNVAGYDAVRLVTGSGGALGIITAVHMMVRGMPEADETVLLPAPDGAGAVRLGLRVRDAVACDALEILSPAALHASGGAGTRDGQAWTVAGGRDGQAWTVAVRLRGSAGGVAEAVDRVRRMAGAVDRAPDGSLWERLCASEAAAPLQIRLEALPDRAAALIAAAARFCAKAANARSDTILHGTGPWRVAAHATAGVVRIWHAAGAPTLDPDGFARAAATLGTEVATVNGTCRYVTMPDALRDAAPADSAPAAPAAELMRKIARSFDPAAILMPGRHLWQ
jgi:glycolate oxidase FAD binding subunit